MKIHIPTPLRVYTGGEQTVSVSGTTVGESLAALTAKYPELQPNLFTGDGKLRSFVNVYLNDDDIRYLPGKEETAAGEDDELTIIPSIAGGDMDEALRNPQEDLEHAHALLALMSPGDLLKATYALEEIIEASPRFLEKLRLQDEEAGADQWSTMEEVLADHGLTMKDLQSSRADFAGQPKQTEAA